MINRRLLSVVGVVAIVAGACSNAGATQTATATGTAPAATQTAAATPTQASAKGCTVGVSWNNYNEERWAKWDEPAIQKTLEAAGAVYIKNDAKSSAQTQLSNVEALISQGAKVLIILAQDGEAIKPAVATATAAGIPVIAYDRLIEDPNTFYITFDNVLVGKMQAQAVLAAKSSGNFVIIKGNKADANADFLRSGMVQAGVPDVGKTDPSGKIKIVGETYTDNWDPAKAQTEMEQFLTAQKNAVDAVISENDGMAGGVVAALAAQGLAGKVPVSGQDGDAPALNRIALGTQTVDVWKDARKLGESAANAALQFCTGAKLADIQGSSVFKSPKGNSLNSVLLQPIAITKDNLNVVLDAGWITKDKLCQGVSADKAPAACK